MSGNDISEVDVYGYDVAYPKELTERMNAFLEEHLYQGMELEEKAKLQEEMCVCAERTNGNRAVDIMLHIEDQDMEMLRGGNYMINLSCVYSFLSRRKKKFLIK